MDYIKVFLTSAFSLVALFLLTRINGNRQISEMTMFDYIIGISIGSIAAEMATELERPLHSLVAMSVYALVSFLIAVITAKSLVLRRFLFGKSITLMRGGKLLWNNFKRAHLDINEFLMQCRTNGYFDISVINTAILEPSGKLSILPYPSDRPATPNDFKLTPQAEDVFYCVISDGKILTQNLNAAGFDTNWLKNELKVQGEKDINKIFFADLDKSGTLHIFEKNEKILKNDFFQ